MFITSSPISSVPDLEHAKSRTIFEPELGFQSCCFLISKHIIDERQVRTEPTGSNRQQSFCFACCHSQMNVTITLDLHLTNFTLVSAFTCFLKIQIF